MRIVSRPTPFAPLNNTLLPAEEYSNALYIETNWQSGIIASYGPVEGTPQAPDTYELTTEKNAELQAINDKLILVGPQS